MIKQQIKFGTDGWRAIIADTYTKENVKRVSEATCHWMAKKGMTTVVIGYDTRFGGKLFAETAASVFGNFGMKIKLSNHFVSTPMVSLANVKLKADMGIVITASHNPPSYNGYKLKSAFGGPTIPSEIAEIEALIPDTALGKLKDVATLEKEGLLEKVDLEKIYIDHVRENFDLDMIDKSGINIAYDAMYGAGQEVLPKILPKAHLLHCDYNPSFMGQAPEPIHRNLGEMAELMAKDDRLAFGLANDGDADRIGLYDSNGKFVDSHHILLLLLYYLAEFKKMTGKVIVTFSVTDKMQKLADHYNLDLEVTKIGFKYIAEIMTKEDVLVGGEESGGLAIKGHIPERDGIWIGLTILEFMAMRNKSLEELIQEVYDKVGEFATDRDDLHLTDEKKNAIINRCKEGTIEKIGPRHVNRVETIDGYKFYLSSDEWLLVRPSGTEPVLRVYAQANDPGKARALLDDAHITLQEGL